MKGKDGKYPKSNIRHLKPYSEQMARNTGLSSWLDAHVGNGPTLMGVEPGTLNAFNQRRVPNLQLTAEDARRPKCHRPNKRRHRHALSGMVKSTSSVNSSRSNDCSHQDPAPVRHVLDASLDQLPARRSR